MVFKLSIFRNCMTYDLLVYSWSFIRCYNFSFFPNNTSKFFNFNSVSKRWFIRVSSLIKKHKYIYRGYRSAVLKKNLYHSKFIANYKFKIIELSFCFLILLFFRNPFSFSVNLSDYLRLFIK
jgi:hypothetical protein